MSNDPKPLTPFATNPCSKRLACQGLCRLEKGHPPPCLCAGDIEDKPNSCPASKMSLGVP